jgi:hypothetical protein
VPRYFLDLIEDDHRKVDRFGIIADNLECAKQAAKQAARDFIVSRLLEDKDPDGRRYEILDERGKVQTTVCFRDLLPKALSDAQEQQ